MIHRIVTRGRLPVLGGIGALLAGSHALALPRPLHLRAAVVLVATAPARALSDTSVSANEAKVADTTGVAAPSFTVMHWLNSTRTDSTVKFGDGHVYILGFTGTWCEGCPATYPPLTEIAQQYASKGVRVILVVGLTEVTVDHIKQYYEREQITLPIAVAGLGSPVVFEDYGIMSVPTIVVIDQAGIVQYRWHGAGELTANSTAALNALLKTPAVSKAATKKGHGANARIVGPESNSSQYCPLTRRRASAMVACR